MTAPALCLTCRGRKACVRGLCEGCYKRHRDAIRAGRADWVALVADGLALPAQAPGRAWRHWTIKPGVK